MSRIGYVDRAMDNLRPRSPREKEEGHLEYIRQLPCLVCPFDDENISYEKGPIEAAHIRYGDVRFAKNFAGIGEKPNDQFTVPLCSFHHRVGPNAQHSTNERAWWKAWGIDAVRVAAALYLVTGNIGKGMVILAAAKVKSPIE